MAKKQNKRKPKVTDWHVGQPLDFPHVPSGIEGLARDEVNAAMHGLFSLKRQKHKKK
jgi:hypothetical protein